MPMPMGAPQATPPAQGPAAAPMAHPTPNEGGKQMGAVTVESAMQMLEQALPSVGSNTPEGGAILDALSKLSKHFNRQKSKDLVPAQLMELARAQKSSPLAGMIQGGGMGGQGTPPPGAQPPMPQAA